MKIEIDKKIRDLLIALISQIGVIIILVYSIAWFIMGQYQKWQGIVNIFIGIAVGLAIIVIAFLVILSIENIKTSVESKYAAKFQQELERIIKRE
jgi:uncharacterized membrane protein